MSLPIRLQRHGSIAAPLPRRAHADDAGLDLHAAIPDPITIRPQHRATVPTGWAFEIPTGYVGLVLPRSGVLREHGIMAGVGVIDAPFRGGVSATLINTSDTAYTVRPMDRAAQLVIVKCESVDLVLADSLTATDRGANGFGSSGL